MADHLLYQQEICYRISGWIFRGKEKAPEQTNRGYVYIEVQKGGAAKNY